MTATTTATGTPTAAPGRPRRSSATLAGTAALLRFDLRRDRVRIPAWVLGLGLLTLASANSVHAVYPTAADRASIAHASAGPAVLAMTGPGHYLADYTWGAMLGHRLLGLLAVLAGLMSVLIVSRHTRAEEESGRAELVRSAAVGRHAQLAAALATAAVADLALGLLLAAGLPGLGVPGLDTGGALLFGAATAAAGLLFAAVAAVAVQVTEHARTASGLALAVLGAAYALRAAGDAGANGLAWASPIGWLQRTYPFLDDRWWPLLPALALAAATGAAGFALSTRRDVGAGLRATRPGPPTARPFLGTPLGLALRLHRGLLGGFAVALLLLGAMYGSLLGNADSMLKDVDQLKEALARLGGRTLADSFAAMTLLVVAVVGAVYAVLAMLRPRAEETAGRAEPVLATGVSRSGWLGGHLVAALLGSTAVLLAAGVGFGLAGALSTGDGGAFPRLVGAALAFAPAQWVTVGFAAAVYGWLPRATPLAWLVPAYAFVIGYLGPLLKLPSGLERLSPFGQVPRLPAAAMDWTPLAALTLVAAALIALALAGFRRRDLDLR
ncbi:ABC-2 type transport system permease protein [Kitasatospora sp. MAA19]|uniref:ABC transporter permease n=1 Tax=Kitasatospora sp. MAA19 TaxID=3035090 RepID=UPI002476D13B|nr:ABC transporter permease [Kitasatospora sp. MAA19]MDH6707510.1 ABC-2 type transport system permease protein [Kitasatospora sp. MAA19]